MERKPWIDALRAFAIILVVFGHQIGVKEFFIITSPVKMPLFFAISGYLFKMREGDIIVFFCNWFKKLIVPWFCLALIPFIPKFLKGADFFLFLDDIVSGRKLWFMPCFVIAELIHFCVRKLIKSDYLLVISCTFLTGVGLYFYNIGILNYAMFNRALAVQAFFIIGFLFHKYEDRMINLSWMSIGLGGMIYVILIIISSIVFPKMSLDVHLCQYYNYPYCFLLIIIGIFVLFTAAAKSNISNRTLSVIGQNTLILYIWHSQAIWMLENTIVFLKTNVLNIWIRAFLKTIWAIITCNILAHFINRFVPEIVGKKRQKKLSNSVR